MHESARNFVERVCLCMEAEGMPRIAGRIFGYLLINEGAFSLDELAERLQVSKASVSTNARQLEQIGLVERVSMPGDRRDYYRMEADAWERMLQVAQRKWEVLRGHFTAAAAALPDEMEAGRRRLIQAEQFHLLMIDGVDRLLERWRARQQEMESLAAEEVV
jgi:DNA-binding transcriptional regulator GbsR (MarR family)